MAAKLKRDLRQEVEMVHGHYGEFKVLVDDRVVADAGPMGVLGIVPSDDQIVEAVRQAIGPA